MPWLLTRVMEHIGDFSHVPSQGKMTRDVQNLSKNYFLNFNFKSDTKIGRAIPIELIYVYIWRITALARQVMEQKS